MNTTKAELLEAMKILWDIELEDIEKASPLVEDGLVEMRVE